MSINVGNLNRREQIPKESPTTYLSNLAGSLSDAAKSAADSSKTYVTDTLKNVSDKTDEQKKRAQSEADEARALRDAEDESSDPNDAQSKENIANAKRLKKGFNLMEIFKIVPIGINVIAKGPNLVAGAADVMVGLQKALINTGINLFDFFRSFFSFSVEGFKFAFILLVCFLENMSNFNSCVIFYVIDIVFIICFLLLFSFLNLLDALFFEKTFGIGLVQIIMKVYDMIIQIEEMIYEFTGFHLLQYPKCVQKMCYTCSIKTNKREVTDTGINMMNAVTSRIPRRFMEPIHRFISAGKNFASIFKI
jgi:hypothetical protein